MDLGIDRFRGHEHQRGVLGLAGNQIFFGDVADMFQHVIAQPLAGELPLLVAARIVQRGHRFQRKFRVDAKRALVGQEHHAIRPLARRKRELEFVRTLRHAVLHDRFHPRLAERAARLLVGEHVAQRGHLGSKVGEVLVRIVDDAEPLMEHAQAIHGVARSLFHRLADPMGHRIQPLVDGAGHLGLTARQGLSHRVDAPGRFALRAQHLAQALFELVGADRLRHRKLGAASPRSGDHDGDDNQQYKYKHAEAGQRVVDADRPVADHEKNLVHATLCSRFAAPARTKREHLW